MWEMKHLQLANTIVLLSSYTNIKRAKAGEKMKLKRCLQYIKLYKISVRTYTRGLHNDFVSHNKHGSDMLI